MRVGLFGLLGAGNSGNDGSLEAVLAYLRADHPDAELSCLCSGPEVVSRRYGIPALQLYWYYGRDRTPSLPARVVLKAVGKVRDSVRVLGWVRRQEVVIVPGTGVLESTLPIRAWGFPFALFQLCLFGRLTGTKVALVNIGSNVIRQPALRFLYRAAARLAHYRSFRDAMSRDAMREMGVDTSADGVHPDLVFALPMPSGPVDGGAVGVGVMDFHGSTDDRGRAEEIHHSYVDGVRRFVRWLVDEGRRVRLFTGDEADQAVVRTVMADVATHRPDLDPSTVVNEPAATLGELMRQMGSVDVVVATRYHNVVCALKLAKPTVSISYSAKSDRIMAKMGLEEFCHDARTIDVDRLIEQFATVERRAGQLRPMLAERSAERAAGLGHQYKVLSAALFPPATGDAPDVRRAS